MVSSFYNVTKCTIQLGKDEVMILTKASLGIDNNNTTIHQGLKDATVNLD